MTAQQVNALFVKALGYTVEWADVNAKAEELKIAVVAADETLVLRGEAFATMRAMLDVPKMDETDTFGTSLGLTNYEPPTPPAPTTVVITDAVAINSTLVEVDLDSDVDAPTALTVDQFVVTDDEDATVAVEKAEFAPWDADNYTVLLTLEAMDAGTLYTVTSGDDSANFGGKSADSTDPTVSDVTSTDYNEVTITFSEAVLIDDLSIEFTEKYGDKDELAVLDYEYSGSKKVVVTTDGQADATLYAATIDGAVDLAGNAMDEDDAQTFVGQEMTTDEMTVVDAGAEDYNQVVVNLDQKIDTVDVASFTIKEKYGDKDEIAVLEAVVITDASDYTKATADDKAVLLTVEDLTEATLYEITVEDMTSIYGNDLDTDQSATFVGTSKPSDEVAVSSATSNGNTEVVVTFDQKIDADTVTVDSFTITEKYGDKDELAVLDVDVDGVDVTLTTEAQSDATLYVVEVADVVSIYGNDLDTDNDDTTFVGTDVADKFASFTVGRLTDTKIAVIFDQKVSSAAANVALYSIDNSVGYPEKAVKATSTDQTDYAAISDYTTTIILTIPKTTVGKLYTLTVAEGAENVDGVASTKDLTAKFAGQGNASTLPEIEAVIAVDDSTIEVYFDRDVDDSTIDGPFWDSSLNTLVVGALEYDEDITTKVYVPVSGGNFKAWMKDGSDNVLVIRANSALFDTSVDDAFVLKADAAKVDGDTDQVIQFAGNASDVASPAVEAVVAINKNTIKVYFDAAVADVDQADFTIDSKADGTGVATAVTGMNIIDEKTVELLTADLASGTYYLRLVSGDAGDADKTVDTITDLSGFVELASTVNATGSADYAAYQFAGSAASAGYVSDISVVMTDEQTVVVYFPEAMDLTDMADEDNFDIYDAATAGNLLAEVTGADADAGNDKITNSATWDADDNTLTFNLNASIAGSVAYLEINSAVANAVGSKAVTNSDGDTLRFQFATSTKDAAEVTIASVTANADDTIVIKLSDVFSYDNGGGDTIYNADTEFLADFNITITSGSTTTVVDDAAELADVIVTDLAAKTITVTLDGINLLANDTVEVEILATVSGFITSDYTTLGLDTETSALDVAE
jgi:hypothetical protein